MPRSLQAEARIYRSRVYFFEDIPGISGFKRWEEREYGIALGSTVKGRGLTLGKPAGSHGDLNTGRPFRLQDGRLPEYQDRATFDEACKWLQAAPGEYRIAWIVDALQT